MNTTVLIRLVLAAISIPVLLLAFVGCGDGSSGGGAAHSTNVVVITEANFQAEVMASTKPVLVDFWAPWCGPCRKIAPIVNELADDFHGRAKVAKVNVDEAGALAQKFGVKAIPTLLIFKGGRVVDQATGFRSKAELAAQLDKVIGEVPAPASRN